MTSESCNISQASSATQGEHAKKRHTQKQLGTLISTVCNAAETHGSQSACGSLFALRSAPRHGGEEQRTVPLSKL
eukprot:1157805-Pelagomonas_calceolata.AAC.13